MSTGGQVPAPHANHTNRKPLNMNLRTTLAACALLWLGASAQSRLDMGSKAQLHKLKVEQRIHETIGSTASPARSPQTAYTAPTRVLALAKLAEGVTADQLRAQGIDVVRCQFGFAFLSLPIDQADSLSALPCFKAVQLERQLKQYSKYAREWSGVDPVHEGTGLPQTYTGKNVVCGIIDMGFDLNHANFLDAEGNNRVKYFETLAANNYATSVEDMLTITPYNTPEAIARYTTDNNTAYHGTHTMGIMAGGYRGAAQVALLAGEDGHSTSLSDNLANPYYGMAPDADIIAASCASLTDLQIAQAAYDLALYADYAQKPVVINLSLGTNQGPHDGSGLACQLFDIMAEQIGAKIVIAAGNEGEEKLAVNKRFTAEDNELKSFIEGDTVSATEGNLYVRYGQLDVYSDNTEPFEIQAVIYNTDRNKVAKRFTFTLSPENAGQAQYWCSSSFQESDTDIVDATLNNYFSGYVGIGWAVDSLSMRAYAAIDFYAVDNPETNAGHKYRIGFIVNGKEGQRIDCYMAGDYARLDNNGVEGWDDGSRNGTVSDMATARHTLCVGSYNSTGSWAQLDGFAYSLPDSDLVPGEVTPLTSYGTLSDGRNLPDVLAPGAYVVSSMSRYYLKAIGAEHADSLFSAVALTDNRDPYIWSIGTSMACPVVTGIIALWLEADPTLTMKDIKEIIALTSVKDEALAKADPVQVGAGRINAYEGMKEVLRRKGEAAIHSPLAASPSLLAMPAGSQRIKLFMAGQKQLDVEVYDLSGRCVLNRCAAGDETVIDLSTQPKGTYILRVNGAHTKCSITR